MAVDDFIKANKISPNKQFHYKVRKLNSLNPSALGWEVAFFNLKEELLYHRKKSFAHEIHSLDELGKVKASIESNFPDYEILPKSIVKWSKEGNVAYFLEYLVFDSPKYCEIILDLQQKICFRIQYGDKNYNRLDKMIFHEGFPETEVFKYLHSNGFARYPMIQDPLYSNLFQSWFSKWK